MKSRTGQAGIRGDRGLQQGTHSKAGRVSVRGAARVARLGGGDLAQALVTPRHATRRRGREFPETRVKYPRTLCVASIKWYGIGVVRGMPGACVTLRRKTAFPFHVHRLVHELWPALLFMRGGVGVIASMRRDAARREAFDASGSTDGGRVASTQNTDSFIHSSEPRRGSPGETTRLSA